MPTLAVGPGHGTLVLLTGVEGPAATMAHSLVLCINQWACETELVDGLPVSVQLEGELPSLVVIKGDGGLMPLTDKQRSKIKQNALRTMRAADTPRFCFSSNAVAARGTGYVVTGQLRIAGVAQPVEVAVEVGAGRTTFAVTGRARVQQTAFGIRPYTDMLGTIRVRDVVEVVLTVIVMPTRDVVDTDVMTLPPVVREPSGD